ncbi:hypothetical protein [Mucilaginibacter paludis]|uniref:Uncharacterized protein n=1 Tax=Mucilaginibacter paludis DSM 18603 TaxID=714943 RepID=H1Y9R1_9SPHI|nr:hypothetical protein [Mucilaginibacter paludis]EHQ30563.1 hypothetical protein Mucpa_6510 [Mucilaginibacter paludis DSM 18603]
MNEHEHIIEIPELLSNRICKRLILKFDGLVIEKPFIFDERQFIAVEDMVAFRLGIKWIRGIYFVLGRQFIVELKHQNGAITTIKLTSVYNIRNQKYDEIWSAIIDHVYCKYFSSHLQLYVELYEMGQTFNLSELTFNPDGITWDKNKNLHYNQISISCYRTYFVIHNKNNPKQNKSLSFLNDWNAYLVQALVRYIVEDRRKILSR